MLAYREIPASAKLARYIKCFWSLQSAQPTSNTYTETIPPDGCIDIIFNLADRFERRQVNSLPELQPTAIVAGQMSFCATVRPTGRIELFGIRLTTAGACAFFPQPLNELTDKIQSIDHVWPLQAKLIEERIGECSSFTERVAVAEMVLATQLLKSEHVDRLVEEAVRRLGEWRGRLSMNLLLRDLGISERQLERRFENKVGISPIKLFRILRFQKVFATQQEYHFHSWASVAYDCGYYDQAHLIRDFRAFTGQSPASYFKYESDFSQYFTGRHLMSEFSNSDL